MARSSSPPVQPRLMMIPAGITRLPRCTQMEEQQLAAAAADRMAYLLAAYLVICPSIVSTAAGAVSWRVNRSRLLTSSGRDAVETVSMKQRRKQFDQNSQECTCGQDES